MEKPKSITQLSKEQLEDMCLNLMHVDKVKTEMINQLEANRDEAIECMKTLCDEHTTDDYDIKCEVFEKISSILERGKE